MDPRCVTEADDLTTAKADSGDFSGHFSLPVFVLQMATTRRLGMEALCLTGLCWVENGRVRLQRHHEKAGLGRRLRNARGYPFDLLSPQGVEYARSRWSECLASVERWYRSDRGGRVGRAKDSVRRVLPGGATVDKIAFLRRENSDLTHRELSEALGVSLRTVERCVASLQRRSRVVGCASPIRALGPATKYSTCVSWETLGSPSRQFDHDYDPAEDIIHHTYPDGRPCVIDGVPFDLDGTRSEAVARHAAKTVPPAPPRPPSPRYDHLRPTLFPVRGQATSEEAWHALEAFRVSRHGSTCTAMEITFVLDHFPTVPVKDVADMVGVSAPTVRRRKENKRI